MKVSYVEGLASYDGPESCVHVRKGVGEALTGGRAGRVSSREIHASWGEPRDLWSADVLESDGRQHPRRRFREAPRDFMRSETPSTYVHTAHGNREIPRLAASRDVVRIGKSKDERR